MYLQIDLQENILHKFNLHKHDHLYISESACLMEYITQNKLQLCYYKVYSTSKNLLKH